MRLVTQRESVIMKKNDFLKTINVKYLLDVHHQMNYLVKKNTQRSLALPRKFYFSLNYNAIRKHKNYHLNFNPILQLLQLS